jgi:tRNA1(Val) A37 N6-methylase TrmN6
MVEWANVKSGEKILEPSAGHGAIARYFPEDTHRTLVEPSSSLASRAALNSPGARVVVDRFENLDTGANKFDAIVMNPPFGSGGATAIEHRQGGST